MSLLFAIYIDFCEYYLLLRSIIVFSMKDKYPGKMLQHTQTENALKTTETCAQKAIDKSRWNLLPFIFCSWNRKAITLSC